MSDSQERTVHGPSPFNLAQGQPLPHSLFNFLELLLQLCVCLGADLLYKRGSCIAAAESTARLFTL